MRVGAEKLNELKEQIAERLDHLVLLWGETVRNPVEYDGANWDDWWQAQSAELQRRFSRPFSEVKGDEWYRTGFSAVLAIQECVVLYLYQRDSDGNQGPAAAAEAEWVSKVLDASDQLLSPGDRAQLVEASRRLRLLNPIQLSPIKLREIFNRQDARMFEAGFGWTELAVVFYPDLRVLSTDEASRNIGKRGARARKQDDNGRIMDVLAPDFVQLVTERTRIRVAGAASVPRRQG